MEIETFTPLVTAHEAFPALEQEFLASKEEIRASFRIFDLTARLRSDDARQIGDTWFDLLVDTLNRGVRIDFTLADFDPYLATDLHLGTMRSARHFAMAAECAERGELAFRAALHPHRCGLIPRVLLAPFVHAKFRRNLRSDTQGDPDVPRIGGVKMSHLSSRTGDHTGLGSRWFPAFTPATHHQKLAVFDRKVLFIGGLDVDDRRYDTPRHDRSADQTWHDISARVTGPVVDAALGHLERFVGNPSPNGTTPQFIRTQSRVSRSPLALSPKTTLAEIEEATLELIESAEHLIYMETQFFRSERIAKALAHASHARPKLRLILMLPAAPEDAAFGDSKTLDVRYGEYLQARAVRRVQRAFGKRALVAMPLRPVVSRDSGRAKAHGAPIIYIHSKITICDDRAAILSSANLNGRSLRWDTEAGIRLSDPRHVEELRHRAFSHWLPKDAGNEYYEFQTAADAWTALAQHNIKRPPEERRGFLAPYDPRAAEEIGTPLPGLPSEAV